MKIVFIAFLLFSYYSNGKAQLNKFTYKVDYSINYSKVIDPTFDKYDGYNDMKVGHNIFVKSEYGIFKHLAVSVGIGYLSSSEYLKYYFNGQHDIVFVINHRYHNYLVVPAGFNYHIRSFALIPEIGIAFNLSNKFANEIKYTDGTLEIIKKSDKLNVQRINRIGFPVLLSLVKEFYVDDFILSPGIKGYYFLSELDNNIDGPHHNLGFGFMIGIGY